MTLRKIRIGEEMLEGRFDLGTIDSDVFECRMERFITDRTAVVGMSGSGKSHLIGVIAEELCENGASFVIIDPEGEYSSLKEKFEVVWAGKDPGSDVKLTRSSIKKLAKVVVDQRARLILDTSDSEDSSEELEVVSSFLDEFYELETKSKRPILVIVEEADRFAPQFGGEKVKRLLEISRRGRKRGIGLLIATQRPQMVDKNVLSQCGNQLIGRLRTKNDLKAVDLFFSSPEKIRSLPELRLGEFHAMGEFNPEGGLLKVKGRITSSLGSTPEGKGKRRKEFSVDDFVSDLAGNAPVRINEKKSITTDSDTKKKSSIKKKKEPSRAELKGIGFKIKKSKALAIAKEEIDRTLFTGKSKESIDSVEKVYWPYFICTIVESKRFLLKMKKKDHKALLDPVLLRFVRFKDGYESKVVFDIDSRLLELWRSSRTDIWKDIRIIRRLQKEDMTSADLSADVQLGMNDVRSIMRGLSRKKIISSVGKAGSSSIYRPLVKIKNEGIKDIETDVPRMKSVEIKAGDRIVKENIDGDGISDLIKGLFDNCDLIEMDTIHLPYFLVDLHHKKKRTQRTIIIEGLTGDIFEISSDEKERVKMD